MKSAAHRDYTAGKSRSNLDSIEAHGSHPVGCSPFTTHGVQPVGFEIKTQTARFRSTQIHRIDVYRQFDTCLEREIRRCRHPDRGDGPCFRTSSANDNETDRATGRPDTERAPAHGPEPTLGPMNRRPYEPASPAVPHPSRHPPPLSREESRVLPRRKAGHDTPPAAEAPPEQIQCSRASPQTEWPDHRGNTSAQAPGPPRRLRPVRPATWAMS